MKMSTRRIALTIAAVTVAASTVFSAATASATGSADWLFRPPPPTGGDGQHQPGEPCGEGRAYAWEYDTHYGWGWILICR